MIDPRTTNLIGQRVLILRRSAEPHEVLGQGTVRVVDYQGSHFAILIEALTPIPCFGTTAGGLFVITTSDETLEIVINPAPAPVNTTTRHLTYIEPNWESFQRGGSTRTAACLCSWRGPQRATLEMVFDDAATHERENQK